MRYCENGSVTAAEIVNNDAGQIDLEKIFEEYGQEEKQAKKIARQSKKRGREKKFETSRHLAAIDRENGAGAGEKILWPEFSRHCGSRSTANLKISKRGSSTGFEILATGRRHGGDFVPFAGRQDREKQIPRFGFARQGGLREFEKPIVPRDEEDQK